METSFTNDFYYGLLNYHLNHDNVLENIDNLHIRLNYP